MSGRLVAEPPLEVSPPVSYRSARAEPPAGHHHDPDDSFVVERQAHCKVTLIRYFAGFTPASDLVRPGDDVALDFLELRLCLFHGELLVSARLFKHLSARCDASKGAARGHGFDIGIEQLFGRVQVMRDDSLDELACASERHRRNLVPTQQSQQGSQTASRMGQGSQ
jgi:hypothetical protein